MWSSMRLITAVLWVAPLVVSSLVLDGSKRCYVRFPRWYQAFENVISFEFRTRRLNGLLFYSDDGGFSNFFEVRLFDGQIHLQFRLGSNSSQKDPASIMVLGKDLNDNQWHKVVLYQFWDKLKLEIDATVELRTLLQKDYVFGRYETNSDVFVGGIPLSMPIGKLSYKLVKQTDHLQGSVRNVVYRTFPQGVTAPHILDSDGIRESDDDYCRDGFCKNGGFCYSTDDGPKCDCSHVDFEGSNCEKRKRLPEASFFGEEFISYDLSDNRNGFMSREELFEVNFKTRRPNGMIFYSGDHTDYFHVALRDGAIVARSYLGSGGVKEARAEPPKNGSPLVRFNDNQWHHVSLHRRLSLMTVNVDGIHSDVQQVSGSFQLLGSTVAFLGGKPNTKLLAQGLEVSRFVGCLSNAKFRADGRQVNFLEDLDKRNDSLVKSFGSLELRCREMSAPDPYNFRSPDTFVKLPSWQAGSEGTLSFKFKTNEPDGLIVYNRGADTNASDYFALELIDGRLYLMLNLGSGTLRVKASTLDLHDRKWHLISLERYGKVGSLTVDSTTVAFTAPGSSVKLDLGGPLYIGSLPWLNSKELQKVSSSVWTASMKRGFVGCIKDLTINSYVTDLSEFLHQQSASSIEVGCSDVMPICPSAPCLNGGECIEGWGRPLCDCTTTPFVGKTCDKDATVISFEENQFVRLSLSQPLKSQADDISMRFRTRSTSSTLLSTSSRSAFDKLELTISEGHMELKMHVGQLKKKFNWGKGVSDNRWHRIKVKRRGPNLTLTLDENPPSFAEITVEPTVLEYETLTVGLSESQGSTGKDFQGEISSLMFDGFDIFNLVTQERKGGSILSSSLNMTASFGTGRNHPNNPVTFGTREGFALLPPRLLSAGSFQLFFQFRTLESTGLILFSNGLSQDYIAVELLHGRIRYSFNLGDGSEVVSSRQPDNLGDFKWHSVSITKPSNSEHFLTVDNAVTTYKAKGVSKQLNLRSPLYVGGIEKQNYTLLPPAVQSKFGFRGCLASLEVDGSPIDLLHEAYQRDNVEAGCEGPNSKCDKVSCANGGVCVQGWNSYSCDCSMTSYSGPTCKDESVSFNFGPQPGLIIMKEEKHPSTTSDSLAFALTTNSSDSIVLRVDSGSSQDFLMIEIVNGHAYAIYNLGDEDYHVGDSINKVADGRAHVIKFVRERRNATFQVDNNAIQTHFPIGRKLEVFNFQSQVQVGGRMIPSFWDRKRRSLKGRVERPFNGLISGVSFNKIRPLDLAAEKDPRIIIDGNVRMVKGLPTRHVLPSGDWNMPRLITDRMMGSSVEPERTTTDDLIVTSEGSGCSSDNSDEEDCEIIQPSTTDLITPVIPTGAYTAAREQEDTTTIGTLETSARLKTTLFNMPTTTEDSEEPEGSGCDDEDETGCTLAEPIEGATEPQGERDSQWKETDTVATTSTPAKTAKATTSTTTFTTTTAILPTLSLAPLILSTLSTMGSTTPTPTTTTTTSTSTSTSTTTSATRSTSTTATSRRTTSRRTTTRRERISSTSTGRTTGGPLGAVTPAKPIETVATPPATSKTTVIAGVAVGLIVVVIIVIFVIFKCRQKSANSYSMEDNKSYEQLSSNEVPPQPATALPPQGLHINGSAAKVGVKKKKDVKEWYV